MDQLTIAPKGKPIVLSKPQGKQEKAKFILHPQKAVSHFQLLQKYLPNCEHHFAVKACSEPLLLQALAEAGMSFDIASSGEIELLNKCTKNTSHRIHTHPIKSQYEIEYAINAGITIFVVDNQAELEKFESYKDEVQLLVRLAFSNSDAQIDLSSKFGLAPADATNFISAAHNDGYKIAGVSFHVGSQMPNPSMHIYAIEKCRDIYNELAQKNIQLEVLDIGGGFPFIPKANEHSYGEFFTPITTTLRQHFANTRIITEPGRFIAAPAATLECTVIGKSIRNGKLNYYINDGLYGCLSAKVFDAYDIKQLRTTTTQSKEEEATIFGPTCDSFDKICDAHMMPVLNIKDKIIFPNIGAYSIASRTNFNSLNNLEIQSN
ncbi:MAG: hypothetical protein RL660_1791 [Bacteroidota bacterium]|jgi:ornithine decarboxylase